MNKAIAISIAAFLALLILFSGCVTPDNGEAGSFALSGLAADKIIVTEAVPKYEAGKEVANYNSAFDKQTIDVKNGNAEIALGKNPVFIELDGSYPKADLASYEESPFGFHPANVLIQGYSDNEFADAANIGIKFARQGLYVFWFLVQQDINLQDYDFSEYDGQWKNVPENINILANIDIAPSPLISPRENPQRDPSERERALRYVKENSFLPSDEEKYAAFVHAAVERYDGDGVDDMPGLKNPVRYWQVGNEPPSGLNNYAEFLKLTYDAIKESCARCKVLIGGVPGMPPASEYISQFDSSYLPILNDLPGLGKSFDIFDFHWYGNATGDYKGAEEAYAHIKQKIDALGLSPEEYWITEMGAYSGDPAGADVKYQTEAQQAGDYLKRFVFSLSLGVKKIFPAFGLAEGFKRNDGYFDHTGLIYDGIGSNDLGAGVKKLGYYTYKLMAEKLEGSDWGNVEVVRNGTGNIYVYKFYRKDLGKSIYVAWQDDSEEATDETTWKPESEGDVKGKCGDGICGPVEEEKGICPEDCTGETEGAGAGGAMQGKCGDGVCGPVEKEKGICPEDCG